MINDVANLLSCFNTLVDAGLSIVAHLKLLNYLVDEILLSYIFLTLALKVLHGMS